MLKDYYTFKSPKLTIQVLTIAALMLALDIILWKISIGPSYFQIALGFISMCLMGYFLGPWLAGTVELMSDFLNSTVFGGSSTFAWQFLIGAFLGGMVYGVLLHGRKWSWLNIVVAHLIILGPISLLLDTTIVSFVYHIDWHVVFMTRAVRNFFTFFIETFVLISILKGIAANKFLREIKHNL
ncbi:folate family ECF transporter S component [Leuconostoc pseudomesenteroides]|uniref:folate family ECF transporter S component n=1 Tax=Leuconostoc pseudomesenteroides TaxID=33968 RepID=UPI0039EB157C